MAERFLVSYDIQNPHSFEDNGLDLKTISYLHRVHITATPEALHNAVAFIRDNFNCFAIYCDCIALKSLEDILSLLNNGGAKVLVAFWQMKAIVENRLLVGQDLDRLIISFDHSVFIGQSEQAARTISGTIKSLALDSPIAIHIQGIHDRKMLDTMDRLCKMECNLRQYVTLTHNIPNDYVEAANNGFVAIVPASELTVESKKFPNLMPAHILITSAIHTDRADGLFPTIVTDENGITLGLVYSSRKSIEVALQTGRGVYHSRRHGLWFKGQESGHTQDLIKISVDCDADSLQFNVRQRGEGKIIGSQLFPTLFTKIRLLPFEDFHLLWPLLWFIPSRTDAEETERIGTRGLLYFSTI